MPKDLGKSADKLARRQYKLTNKVGGMGRYGVIGTVEKLENRRLNREKAMRKKLRIPGLK